MSEKHILDKINTYKIRILIFFFKYYFCMNLIEVFFLGEMIIAEAQNVLLFTPVNEQKTGQSGVLFVTNFRLSFVTSHKKYLEVN